MTGGDRKTRWPAWLMCIAAGAHSAFGGCGLQTSGALPAAPTCTDIGDCDDKNPCTTDRCDVDTEQCENKPAPDGDPLEQLAGDCQSVVCEAGVSVGTPDDTDSDDGNPCTDDACDDGVATHAALADGDVCKLGASEGQCQAGSCVVKCEDGSGCDDGEACTQDTCDLDQHVCTFEPLHGVQTPGTRDAPDDCIYEVCLNGSSATVADDEEVPEDGKDCTEDACIGGEAHNDPLVGETCDAGWCNVDADCVECLEAAHCGDDGSCFTRTCTGWKCGVDDSPAGPLPDPVDGDCQASACDGSGNVVTPGDPSDVPAGDGKQCTAEQCVGGEPQHVVLDGQACNQSGGKWCKGDTCVECLNNGHCSSPETCGGGSTSNVCGCTPVPNPTTCSGKCGTVTNNCGNAVDCGSSCPAGQSCGGGGMPNKCGCPHATCCDGSENGNETDLDCGGGTCPKCANGKSCNVDSDCISSDCNPGQKICK